VLYNTNVSLSPTSRDLAPGRRESWQGFAAPALEYRALQNGPWAAGPTFRGYFNLNEGPLRNLNLESYQPGVFLERLIVCESFDLIPRVQYEFTHDAFDGETFGDRHALAGSSLLLWDGGHRSLGWLAVNHTDFADDGLLPSFTSRDGWTWTAGAGHAVFLGARPLEAVRAGFELERADTDGDAFRYNGVSLYTEAVLVVDDLSRLVMQGGWGYRHYPDFDLDPPRNEHIWRAGARLERRLDAHWLVALVGSYDRFESENELFDAERAIGGILTTFEY
jgi:hypothetical protein